MSLKTVFFLLKSLCKSVQESIFWVQFSLKAEAGLMVGIAAANAVNSEAGGAS